VSVVEIEHLFDDQVFSYHADDKMLHFNVSLLHRMRKQVPGRFRRITMDLDQTTYDLCINHRGIEENKVRALQPASLRDPGYGVILEDDSFVMVDGHHRLVRRFRGGVRVMDFWVTDKPIWQHCLVHYPKELEEFLAEGMPPKVGNPPQFQSHITIHGKGK
jgi:hypothetical protein